MSWGLSINQYDWCPYKKGKFGDRHTQGECHVKMKAEVGVMFLQAKEHQRWTANHTKLGERHVNDFSSQHSDETDLARPWSQISSLQNYEPRNFCCLNHSVCSTFSGISNVLIIHYAPPSQNNVFKLIKIPRIKKETNILTNSYENVRNILLYNNTLTMYWL